MCQTRTIRSDRAALSDPRPRGGVRDDLRGANRALVDRAAGSAIPRPSRRQCAKPERSDLIAPPYPIRDQEVVFEMTYAAQIAPWWIVQPDLQYLVHPGGNVPNPNDQI